MTTATASRPAPDSESVSESHQPKGGTILRATGLSKEFRGFQAVCGVDLEVRAGSVHALIGPNGAGKTTCFNLLTKFIEPTSGQIWFDGHDITKMSPATIARLGMVRSFQISSVFPDMSVLENVRIALQRKHRVDVAFWRNSKTLGQYDAPARALLANVGLDSDEHRRAASLSYGAKRALELATTMALEPRMLLLDEPMAGMTSADIKRTVELIRHLKADRTVLMVEHNISVVEDLCDTITVLARGKVLAEGTYRTVSTNPAVITAYLGEPDDA